MDRLSHLRESLPINLLNCRNYDVEFIILNYNSKDDMNSWILENYKKDISSEIIKLYHTKDPEYFHMSHSKNMASSLCGGDILVNLDVDNVLSDEFMEWILDKFESNMNYIIRSDPKYPGMGGKICVSKINHEKLGGYDETFIGWGFEDEDYINRGCDMGLELLIMPEKYSYVICHDNKLRFKNYPPGMYKKFSKSFLNKTYVPFEKLSLTKNNIQYLKECNIVRIL